MTRNQAVWIVSKDVSPLKIDAAPEAKAGPGEIVIKNAAVAMNPVDWKIQDGRLGDYVKNYPNILGNDVAGIVDEIGEGVTRFRKGQRVMAHCYALKSKNPIYGGFQLYTVALEALTSPIPDSLAFEQAVVLPLAISTAAAGLFEKDQLALPLPSFDKKPTGKTLLVWGAASSVGATVVQLATASGVRVVATASSRNHEFVKSLGASSVIDYKSESVVNDVITALEEGEVIGVYDAISESSSFEPIAEIIKKLDRDLKVATVLPPPKNTQYNMVVAYDITDQENKGVAEAIWTQFVPQALASGQLMAKPDPLIVGKGLSDIEKALDRLKAGVSAKKVVVSL